MQWIQILVCESYNFLWYPFSLVNYQENKFHNKSN